MWKELELELKKDLGFLEWLIYFKGVDRPIGDLASDIFSDRDLLQSAIQDGYLTPKRGVDILNLNPEDISIECEGIDHGEFAFLQSYLAEKPDYVLITLRHAWTLYVLESAELPD